MRALPWQAGASNIRHNPRSYQALQRKPLACSSLDQALNGPAVQVAVQEALCVRRKQLMSAGCRGIMQHHGQLLAGPCVWSPSLLPQAANLASWQDSRPWLENAVIV